MKFKLAGAPLLLNISGKDADDGDKDDGTSQVLAFGVESGLVTAIAGQWFACKCKAPVSHCPLYPHYFPTHPTYDSLPEVSCYVRKFAGIIRSSFVIVLFFLNGSTFD